MKKFNIKKSLIITFVIVIIAISSFLIFNNTESKPKVQYTFNQSNQQGIVKYPDSKFAVISDLHYYDNSLGTSGEAFEKVLKSDRKLLKNSKDLLNLAIDEILKSNVEFVLVPGDLTKDGELINHQAVAKNLSRLEEKGIKVFVIPGNHDVFNPLSYKYEGDKEVLIDNVDQNKFREIYEELGYKEAIHRFEGTLSYVAEPVSGLWLVALDTCRSIENKPGEEEIVGGRLTQKHIEWLTDILKKANENKKAVIVMEHHGVVEHWNGQGKLHPDYLVEDYENVGRLLSSYNARLAFTGHYHAQDISLGDFSHEGFIYDIQTGSLITAPCPIRYCNISDNKIQITSDNIVSKVYPNTDFDKTSTQFVFDTVVHEAYNTLKKYMVSENDSKKIAAKVGEAFIEHYKGDEKAQNKTDLNEKELNLWGRVVYSKHLYVLNGLWNDTKPSDNNVVLDLLEAQ